MWIHRDMHNLELLSIYGYIFNAIAECLNTLTADVEKQDGTATAPHPSTPLFSMR